MSEHHKDCGWHLDQYPWECNCGAVYLDHKSRIEALHEKLAAAYIALSGTDIHASDCATSNAPAYEPGPCDCREAEQ
jgi:hypothetical protein